MKKIKQLEPMEIEKRSFEIISHELSEMQVTLPADQEMITKRVIHTSADFDYIQTLKYSKDAVAIAKRLISEGGARSKIYAAVVGGFSYIVLNNILDLLIDSTSGYGITQIISAVFFLVVVYVASANYRSQMLPR